MEDNLGFKLQELRKSKGLSQADVAEYLHISRQAVSQWETGKAQPDLKSVKFLCKLYDVSLNKMLGEVDGESFEEKRIDETDEQDVDEGMQSRGTDTDIYAIVRMLVIAIVLTLASQVPI